MTHYLWHKTVAVSKHPRTQLYSSRILRNTQFVHICLLPAKGCNDTFYWHQAAQRKLSMYKPTYLCTMYLGRKHSSPRKSCNFICRDSVAAVVLGLQALFLLFLLRVSSHSCETLQELLPTLLGGEIMRGLFVGVREEVFCLQLFLPLGCTCVPYHNVKCISKISKPTERHAAYQS